MNRRGFSYPELLVCIVIFTIVVAIVVPVIVRAREKAKQASCMTTQRQITLALMQYSSEYDNYPRCTRQWGSKPVHWAVPLLPYMDIEGPRAFACLSADPEKYELTGVQPPGFPVTYAVNEYLLAGPAKPEQLPDPTLLAVLADGGNPWSGPGETSGARVLWQASAYFAPMIHRRGAIFAFMDGHLAWLPATIARGKGEGYEGSYEGAYPGAQLYELEREKVGL